MLAGIDFGSKRSGNTVIAYQDERGVLTVHKVEKDEDADAFILSFIDTYPVSNICIDAPLSLPGVYRNLPGAEDFFYRVCDRLASAMSPMFLGGLTARAMKLEKEVKKLGIDMYETYPGYIIRKSDMNFNGYKKDPAAISHCAELLANDHQLTLDIDDIRTWHHFDAVIALLTAIRIDQGTANTLGNPDEGLIYY
jgi:predicted nuclease with RNAse H fold